MCDKNSKHSSFVLWVENSDTGGLKSGRQVAVRCRNATRRRSSSAKMAAPLQDAPNKNSVLLSSFLGSEGVKPIEIHRQMNVQYGDACLSLQQVYQWTGEVHERHQFCNRLSSTLCGTPSSDTRRHCSSWSHREGKSPRNSEWNSRISFLTLFKKRVRKVIIELN